MSCFLSFLSCPAFKKVKIPCLPRFSDKSCRKQRLNVYIMKTFDKTEP